MISKSLIKWGPPYQYELKVIGTCCTVKIISLYKIIIQHSTKRHIINKNVDIQFSAHDTSLE